jgi:hypothetical protein
LGSSPVNGEGMERRVEEMRGEGRKVGPYIDG